MATTLSDDAVQAEQQIRTSIRDTFYAVNLIGVQRRAQIHVRQRFPDTDEEDVKLTTVRDLIVPTREMTSVIEVGLPSINVFERTNDEHIQLDIVYPITFIHEVVDLWDDNSLEYNNSHDLCLAIYLKSMAQFKKNRTLGFLNCVHDYLQQQFAGTIGDEESGGMFHSFDWTLTVHCSGLFE
jgi:hypothetical protein